MIIIRIEKRRSKWAKFLVGEFEDQAASYIQRMVYHDADLIVSLTNSLKIHAHETKSRNSLIGRLSSLVMRPRDPEFIEIDGMRLYQLYKVVEREPPTEILVGGTYVVDIFSLKKMIAEAERKLEAKSMA